MMLQIVYNRNTKDVNQQQQQHTRTLSQIHIYSNDYKYQEY